MAMSLFPHLRPSPWPARQYLFSLGLRLTSSPAKNGLPARHTPRLGLDPRGKNEREVEAKAPQPYFTSSQPPFYTVGEVTSLIPLPCDSVSSRRAGPPPSEIQ